GAHFNPAVTFTLAIFRKFPWADVPIYWVAQLAGAFVGALIGNNPAGNLQPLIIGLSITLIGTSYGYQTGYALNPARDLGPRFFTALFGWGFGVFSRQNWYFWVPIVAPFLGAIAGAGIYDIFIHSSVPNPHILEDPS
ncbi:Aquaporin-3, partial [Linnemannia elongata]